MPIKIYSILAIMLVLVGCGREQKNTDMVMNKEILSDFITGPQVTPQSIPLTPRLPGKAQILGAPFQDFQTQTGSATVLPSQSQTISEPSSN